MILYDLRCYNFSGVSIYYKKLNFDQANYNITFISFCSEQTFVPGLLVKTG